LGDPNFERAVILICEHNERDGSFGLVINKYSHVSVDTIEEGEHLENNLFYGGPVEQNTLHFIHKIPTLEGCIPLKDGLYWGGDYNQLKTMHNLGLVSSKNCRFFLGYSGWSRGQLQSEIKKNAWVTSDFDLTSIFDINIETMWREILKRMGGEYKVLANYPIDPRLN
jgi:putative transcriptional regulator